VVSDRVVSDRVVSDRVVSDRVVSDTAAVGWRAGRLAGAAAHPQANAPIADVASTAAAVLVLSNMSILPVLGHEAGSCR
jgi:hypothetical protein